MPNSPENPYLTPQSVPATPRSSSAVALARKVRLTSQLAGLTWILMSIGLLTAINLIQSHCVHNLGIDDHVAYRENSWATVVAAGASLSWLLLSPTVLFRLRWGVWAGVFVGVIGIGALIVRVPQWLVDNCGHAAITGTLVLLGTAWIVITAVVMRRMNHKLSDAGIPNRWNPDRQPWPSLFKSQKVDGRIVRKYCNRIYLLGWSWIVCGTAWALLTFPAFLILPEELRPTVNDLMLMAVSQVATILVAIVWSALGLAILKRDSGALMMSACVAYATLSANVVNLLIPYQFPANYIDMAAIVFWLLVGIGAYLAVMTHLALSSRRQIALAQLPLTIAVDDLVDDPIYQLDQSASASLEPLTNEQMDRIIYGD